MRAEVENWNWGIGEHSYGSPIALDGSGSSLTIGRFCSIAGNVVTVLGNHITNTATTYPFASFRPYWPTAAGKGKLDDHVPRPVVIESDVWIGFGAIILPGTEIGDGAVNGANALVWGQGCSL